MGGTNQVLLSILTEMKSTSKITKSIRFWVSRQHSSSAELKIDRRSEQKRDKSLSVIRSILNSLRVDYTAYWE